MHGKEIVIRIESYLLKILTLFVTETLRMIFQKSFEPPHIVVLMLYLISRILMTLKESGNS